MTASSVRRIRLADVFVAVCNYGWRDWDADVVFCADIHRLPLIDDGAHRKMGLAVRVDRLRGHLRRGGDIPPDLITGENLWTVPTCLDVASTGTMAFSALLWSGVRTIGLVGFDGTADQRSRYEGQPGYGAPSTETSYRAWENLMIRSAQFRAMSSPWGRANIILGFDREHFFDGCPYIRRVPVSALEEELCQSSAAGRNYSTRTS